MYLSWVVGLFLSGTKGLRPRRRALQSLRRTDRARVVHEPAKQLVPAQTGTGRSVDAGTEWISELVPRGFPLDTLYLKSRRPVSVK